MQGPGSHLVILSLSLKTVEFYLEESDVCVFKKVTVVSTWLRAHARAHTYEYVSQMVATSSSCPSNFYRGK